MSRGFTLIELLYTLVVAALILTIGIPSFQSSIRNSRLTSSANDVVAALQLGRSEAIKRRLPIVICANDGDIADDAACANAAWQNGYMVFVDDSGDGGHDANEQILRAEGAMRGSVNVTLPANQPLQGALTYLPTGFPNLNSLTAAGIMVFCDDRESDLFGRVIAIPQTGRPQASRIGDRPDLGVSCE